MRAILLAVVILVTGCSSETLPAERIGCEGLEGDYLAHAEQLSGTCGQLGDTTAPLTTLQDGCTGSRSWPSTTGEVTWTVEASYEPDGSMGTATLALTRTGLDPCASTYAVTLVRQ